MHIAKVDLSDSSEQRIYTQSAAGYLVGTPRQKYEVWLGLTPEEKQALPKVKGTSELAQAICIKLETSWVGSGDTIGIILSAQLCEELKIYCHEQAAAYVLQIAEQCFAKLAS